MTLKIGSRISVCMASIAGALFCAACAAGDGQVQVELAQKHRPLLHFTPETGWMNDPNGLVYFDGEYHLFYQHYPDDIVWGPMHWGHAVSTDMMRWSHLPIALHPDGEGYIFSGSAIVDRENASGFGDGVAPPLVALFTHHDMAKEKAGAKDIETQGLAYSTDRGRTWTKFDGNPVLGNARPDRDFRDPKVFRDEARNRFVMALAVGDHVEFYASETLKSWTYLSSFGGDLGARGGVWECPDLFPIRVAETGETKWALLLSINPGGPQGGSGTQYFVGDFDGASFTLDPAFSADVSGGKPVWLDWGADNYAGVTWSDIPENDGRRLFIGWMSNWLYAAKTPTVEWRSAMTIPRTLSLRKTSAGYRLFAEPIAEIDNYVERREGVAPIAFTGEKVLSTGAAAHRGEVEIIFEPGAASEIALTLGNDANERVIIGYRAESAGDGAFFVDRSQAGAFEFAPSSSTVHMAPRTAGGPVRMRVVVDVASAELFADDGATVMTQTYFPSSPFDRIAIAAVGGEARLLGGEIRTLRATR